MSSALYISWPAYNFTDSNQEEIQKQRGDRYEEIKGIAGSSTSKGEKETPRGEEKNKDREEGKEREEKKDGNGGNYRDQEEENKGGELK